MKSNTGNRYSSLPKRNFRAGIIRLLEEQYKIVGSHKVLQMIANDILELHREFYPDVEKQSAGCLVWRTTSADCRKPSYGTKVEDYEIKTVILPLVTEEDVLNRIQQHYGGKKIKKQVDRDIDTMARLVKSAYEQGGLLSGAELSVLLNRSLTAISKYIKRYHETHDDILPTKGIILDQGSRPTHKAAIIHLYEQGYPEPDISRITSHTLESVGRYLRSYKNIKFLMEKNLNIMEMVRITGMGNSTVMQYRDLVQTYHPNLKHNKEQRDTKIADPKTEPR